MRAAVATGLLGIVLGAGAMWVAADRGWLPNPAHPFPGQRGGTPT